MGDRRAAPRIPNLGSAPRGEDIAAFLRALSALPLIHGAIVETELDASGSPQYFRHGLGRAFVGAIYIGGANSSPKFGYASPERVASLGYAPEVWFLVNPSSADAGIYRHWVFAVLLALLQVASDGAVAWIA